MTFRARRPRPLVIGVARCGLGRLGVVTRRGTANYRDGTYAYAWLGRGLPCLWRPWSSRSPRWVWGPR